MTVIDIDVPKENYFALYLSIKKNMSAERALLKMGVYDEEKHAGKGHVENRPRISKEKLIQVLIEKAKEKGGTPTMVEIDGDKSMPTAWNYKKHFGSYNEACKIAGLEPNRVGGNHHKREQVTM